MSEEEEEGMEKRGVACDCAANPDSTPKELVKTASGAIACPHCGKVHKSQEEDLTPPP